MLPSLKIQLNSTHILFFTLDGDIGKKLNVKIKPLSPTGSQPSSANLDDIRTSVGMLRLSPTIGVRIVLGL